MSIGTHSDQLPRKAATLLQEICFTWDFCLATVAFASCCECWQVTSFRLLLLLEHHQLIEYHYGQGQSNKWLFSRIRSYNLALLSSTFNIRPGSEACYNGSNCLWSFRRSSLYLPRWLQLHDVSSGFSVFLESCTMATHSWQRIRRALYLPQRHQLLDKGLGGRERHGEHARSSFKDPGRGCGLGRVIPNVFIHSQLRLYRLMKLPKRRN